MDSFICYLDKFGLCSRAIPGGLTMKRLENQIIGLQFRQEAFLECLSLQGFGALKQAAAVNSSFERSILKDKKGKK